MHRGAVATTLHDHLVQFFRSGERRDSGVQLLGLEVEHFMVAKDGTPMGYQATHRHIGARNVLDMLSATFPKRVHSKAGDILEVHGELGSVSLEPAAQLELSLAPYPKVTQVEQGYASFRTTVDPYLEDRGFSLDTSGYHPTRCAEELEIIPKDRYFYMSSYFAKIQSNGELMMRATAATQVSLDFSTEADAVRKMRLGSALAPMFAAIADNTHVFQRKPNGLPLRRFTLWREVDPLRCGTVPGLFKHGFGYESYANWILSASPIYQDSTSGEAAHMASMVWPDTRLKRHVEIRACDCMPTECIMGFVALIKGLFYSQGSMQALEDALGVRRGRWRLSNDDVDDAIEQIEERGHDASVYGRTLSSWTSLLFALARTALDDRERRYLDPLEAFAANKPWWHAV